MGAARKFTVPGGRGLSGHARRHAPGLAAASGQRTTRRMPRPSPAVITGQGEYEHRMSEAETWAAGFVAMWIFIVLTLFLAALAAVIWAV